jgi:TATA-box binding protein (TBP) (component of TFIID and TFIIIB)
MENLRVSTITSVAELNTPIDLELLFKNIEINDKIKYIEKGELKKGTPNKKKRKSRKTKKTTVFFNQATLHFHHEKIINVKLFNNGKIQMTGLKKENQGEYVIKELIKSIQMIDSKNDHKIFLKSHDKYEYDNYRIALINSDFDYKKIINRDRLQEIMISMEMFSSFEPCIYPGVNIKYFYNINNCGSKGICNCERSCNGKGDGINTCRRVTVAVFNSGKIIITGAMNRDQLVECYSFINKVIDNNPQITANKQVIK